MSTRLVSVAALLLWLGACARPPLPSSSPGPGGPGCEEIAALPEEGGRQNLGPCVNSVYDDVLPVISADGDVLYFTRKYAPANVGGTADPNDIWVSRRGDDGRWSEPMRLDLPLNTEESNFVASALPDGNVLLVANTYLPDGTLAGGASLARRGPDGWMKPAPIRIEDWYNRSRYVSYQLSADGTTLLIQAERDDSRGGADLYVSFRQDDTTFSAPLNLGTVNTAGDELTPYLALDGVTLYFSTAGRGGMGDADLFMARRLDSTWTEWSEPVSLGPRFNTPGFDAFIAVPAAGDVAYFASTEPSYGMSDIFQAPLPADVRPFPVLIVYGDVRDAETEEPVGAEIRYVRMPAGAAAGRAVSHPVNGRYQIVLPAGNAYAFHAEASGYYGVSDSLDATGTQQFARVHRDLLLAPIEVGIRFRLNNIYFDFDRADLRPASTAELERLVRFMEENPEVTIAIEGHTDAVGEESFNQGLSERRAAAVREYLVSRGISAERMTTAGFGESVPVAENTTSAGRQKNRRVEVRITGT